MKIGQKPSVMFDSVKPQGTVKKNSAAASKGADRVSLENSAELSRILDISARGAGQDGAQQVKEIAAVEAASAGDGPMERVAQGLLDDTAILQALLGEDLL